MHTMTYPIYTRVFKNKTQPKTSSKWSRFLQKFRPFYKMKSQTSFQNLNIMIQNLKILNNHLSKRIWVIGIWRVLSIRFKSKHNRKWNKIWMVRKNSWANKGVDCFQWRVKSMKLLVGNRFRAIAEIKCWESLIQVTRMNHTGARSRMQVGQLRGSFRKRMSRLCQVGRVRLWYP